ncbi:MAG: chemotaxis protein CheB [bacterium]
MSGDSKQPLPDDPPAGDPPPGDPRSERAGDDPVIVALGASAGGLHPLEVFFQTIPATTGAAFVVVQHLSPDFESMMDQLLERRTAMPIAPVTDGLPVVGGRVYLIPRHKEMRLEGGRLWLTDRPAGHHVSRPIDIFFESLARDAGRRAIAIVLSGTGSDGAHGVVAIHDAGGLVLVQDPDEAQFDGMPRAAAATGEADAVLPVAELAAQVRLRIERLADGATDPAPADALDPDALALIGAALRRRHGIDFLAYKRPTLARRLERRMVECGVDRLAAYAARLTVDEAELDRLFHDLLIGVSSFFRDPDTWRLLAERALPALFAERPADRPIRAWVAGCAAGEEAFTVAILLHEAARAAGQSPDDIKVFATDANPRALAFAGRGLYGADQIAAVPSPLRDRYFVPHDDRWQVSAALRQTVVFARHDLLGDPPFTQIDLVTCRNLLIYLKTSAQQRVLERLRFALADRGWLLLGSSEHAGPQERHFEVVERQERLYRLRHSAARAELFQVAGRATPHRAPVWSTPGDDRWRAGLDGPAAVQNAYQQILDRFVPACLLLDPSGQIVHVFGDAGRFLELGRGRARLDILKVARHPLRGALGAALRRVAESGEPVHQRAVATGDPHIPQIDLRVERLDAPRGAGRPYVAVAFVVASLPPGAPQPPPAPATADDRRLADLEAELDYTREHLSATTEELTASNEELQATNEELLAANEELQSTNEELHSVNEELYTVNTEFRRKNAELTRLNADVDHLLHSSAIGAIFLDAELRIRKFTPAAARYFTLLPRDHDRPLAHLRSDRLDVPALLARAEQVRATAEPWEHTTPLADGTAILVRMLPDHDDQGRLRGVVITLTDVTALARARTAQAESERRLAVFARHVPHVMWLSSADTGEWLFVSDAWRDIWGVTDPEIDLKTAMLGSVHPDDRPVLEAKRRQMHEGRVTRFEYRITRPDGEVRWLSTRNYPIEGEAGEALIAGLTEDITEERTRQALLDQLRRDKERASAIRDAVLQATTEHIFMLDDRGRIVFANQAALRAWQRRADEVEGITLAELHVTTDERDTLERLFDTVLRTGRPQQGEDRLALPQGPATFEFTLTPVRDARWRIAHVVVVARDITRRAEDREAARLSLRRLHTVADAVRDPVALVDDDDRIIFANAAFAALFGDPYARGERDARALLATQRLDAIADLLDDARRTGAEIRQDIGSTRDGHPTALAVRILPAIGDGLFLKLRDVTQSRRATVAAAALQSTPPGRPDRPALADQLRALDGLLAGLLPEIEIAAEHGDQPLTAALAAAREAVALAHRLAADAPPAEPHVDLAALAHEMQPLLALSIPDNVRLVVQAPAECPPSAWSPAPPASSHEPRRARRREHRRRNRRHRPPPHPPRRPLRHPRRPQPPRHRAPRRPLPHRRHRRRRPRPLPRPPPPPLHPRRRRPRRDRPRPRRRPDHRHPPPRRHERRLRRRRRHHPPRRAPLVDGAHIPPCPAPAPASSSPPPKPPAAPASPKPSASTPTTTKPPTASTPSAATASPPPTSASSSSTPPPPASARRHPRRAPRPRPRAPRARARRRHPQPRPHPRPRPPRPHTRAIPADADTDALRAAIEEIIGPA